MSLSHAKSVIEESRSHYNRQRRHIPIKGLTPCEFRGLVKNHSVEYSNYRLHIDLGQPYPYSIFVDFIASISQQIILIFSALPIYFICAPPRKF
jgi:hypothetical protein